MTLFQKYNEIINVNKEKFTSQPLPMDLWVVTEKVHGSNLSLLVTANSIRIASRNQVLDNESQYHRIVEIMPGDLMAKARDLFTSIQKETKDVMQVTIYGELAGGYYDKKSTGTRIQKGVQYAPHNFFIGFDIKVFLMNMGAAFMPKSTAFEKMEAVGMYHVPLLKYGSMKEAFDFDSKIQTKIPSTLFNLPPLEGNMMEGVVISPNHPYFFPSGERIIFKKVNEEFSETKAAKNRPVIPQEVSEELKLAINEVVDFINETRLEHVLSHFIVPTEKDFGQILKEMNQDVMKEFYLTTEISLSKEDEKRLSKEVNKRCASLIKEVWLPKV